MISIITPVYNSEKFIKKTILSVLNQSYKNWEHVLVDDCSVDNSKQIIKEYEYKDKRIKYFKLDKNSGAAVARNKGIELAKGRYIAFLDSDDSWHPNKLEKQLHFMTSNHYSFTHTAYNQISESSGKVVKTITPKYMITYNEALYYNPIGCLTVMYDTKYLGKLFMPLIRKRQDYALWLKILKITNAYCLTESLANYLVRTNSISSNKKSLLTYQWKLYHKIEGLSKFKSGYFILMNILHKFKW
ncbi:glycosyltransferase family 2 protein [Aquimarina sp. ERC-38]|uniref:glycosyltransferase family 2 protein n=1 Tax=Aquimarina sp. ERC-38 TaxID=2949996 RepID=UPI002248454A|nr:glycosyltransferase family 2 protein [Aquimarina sp. ERC-38]UZO81864.1 glycosyltransferase family 2 protein [Aquimarina sp. ERC-38]